VHVAPAGSGRKEVAQRNESRGEDRQLTLFHLSLRAAQLALHARPGVNRLVAGGRLWQRNHAAIPFSAKQAMIDGSPVITVERIFPEPAGGRMSRRLRPCSRS
jgi:hypothetical protein